ncbi:unnamed protein product, partial [Iphiclides podalirius]
MNTTICQLCHHPRVAEFSEAIGRPSPMFAREDYRPPSLIDTGRNNSCLFSITHAAARFGSGTDRRARIRLEVSKTCENKA